MGGETNKNSGRVSKIPGRRSVLLRLSIRALSCAAALPLFFGQADAQIAADKSAPAAQRPAINAAPNGVPLVDIAAPNGRGLSHNKYRDFNIGEPGLIWNNHNAEAGISKLGGVVPGNANLRRSGPAGIILNEVTGGGRSALRGPGEVFGRQAEVIIANPHGITCDGCGFINTPRATLTTGIPQISGDGRLSGFDVRGGDVTFGAKGMNLQSGAGSVDVFDIVSRRVVFSGPVAAHDLGVTAGTGKFDYASREMKELSDIAGKPEYAIDGSELGALQADRIKIVATEKGVGVRMRGDMAAHVGQINLSADGKITLNNLSGREGASVRSRSGSISAAKITSKKDIYLKASSGISLRALGAEGNAAAEAGSGLLSAVEDIISGGNLALASGDKIMAAEIAAGGDLLARADAGIDILSAIANGQAELRSAQGDIIAAKRVNAGGDLRVNAAAGSIRTGELISFGDMSAQAGKDLRIGGNVIAQGDLEAQAGQAINIGEQLGAHGNIAAQAGAGIAAQTVISDKAAVLYAKQGDIAAEKGIKAGGGDLRLTAAAGSVNAGDLVSFGDIWAQADKGLTVSGNAIAQGNLNAEAGQAISVGEQLGAHGNIAARAGAGIAAQTIISDKAAALYAEQGDIAAEKGIKAGGGDLRLTAAAGSVNAGELVSFGDLLAQTGKDLTIRGNAIAQGSLSAQTGGNLRTGGTVIAGMNIAASQHSASGALVMNQGKELNISSGASAEAGSFVSGGAMAVHAGYSVRYDDLVSYNSAYLRADRGAISIDKRTAAAGDISLEASALDLSNNRAKVQTGGTLALKADSIDLSGSKLIYGGLSVRAGRALNISNAEIAAVRGAGAASPSGGTGDIFFAAPGLTTDEKTDILAERNLSIEGNTLDNRGQLAAGGDLRLSLKGDAVNRAQGLIYSSGNAAVLTGGGFTNEYGAIIAEANLLFADYSGAGKSRSLENHAGLIQAGNALTVKTQSLTNEADATPYITTAHNEQKFQFDKPAHYDELGKRDSHYAGKLVYDHKRDIWGAGWDRDGAGWNADRVYRVDRLYNSKEEAYSTITLPGGASYRADNWVESGTKKQTIRYKLNEKASMSVLTDTDTIHNKPAAQGLMQAGGDLRIEAGSIDNRYSAIEAGGDARIDAGTLNNLGTVAYKVTADKCGAGSTCYAYNADGSRDKNGDILQGAAGNIQKAAVDNVSSLIKAGGLLDIAAGQVNNSAAEGSVAGSAQFEKKPVSADPLKALQGMTAGGALFAPVIDVSAGGAASADAGGAGRALRPEAWPEPKPDAGGFGGTVPGQHFIYETRAQFLDVGKFYGSAYFISHIGYKPEQRVLFLGDAYFENQLIDKQMRDLAGEGLGKSAFIPGGSAAEQMKTLLDRGAEYMQAHGLAFGEGLTSAQAAAVDKSMVIYVRQNIGGQEVYAPVFYMAAAERAAASALRPGASIIRG